MCRAILSTSLVFKAVAMRLFPYWLIVIGLQKYGQVYYPCWEYNFLFFLCDIKKKSMY